MNILVINHYAGAPSLGMEYRQYYLAREWQKAGNNVMIVTASHTHLRSKQFSVSSRIEKQVFLSASSTLHRAVSLQEIKTPKA